MRRRLFWRSTLRSSVLESRASCRSRRAERRTWSHRGLLFGLDTVNLDDFDYVCKMDLDLDLPPRYFELLMERMESNPRIGTTSGQPYGINPTTGERVPELVGDEMSVE